MFAYCNNRPTVLRDMCGTEPVETIDLDGDGEIDCYVYEYSYERPRAYFFGAPLWCKTETGTVTIYKSPSDEFQNNPDNFPSVRESAYNVAVIDLEQLPGDNPNLQVRNSYRIGETNQMYAIIDVLLEYSASYKTNWARSRDSLYTEWVEHNRYSAFSESAKHVDFDNADEGAGFIDFLWKALVGIFD